MVNADFYGRKAWITFGDAKERHLRNEMAVVVSTGYVPFKENYIDCTEERVLHCSPLQSVAYNGLHLH